VATRAFLDPVAYLVTPVLPALPVGPHALSPTPDLLLCVTSLLLTVAKDGRICKGIDVLVPIE
jgi:hypothetical protein